MSLSETETMTWEEFMDDVPARVAEVIEEGPFPLTRYDSSKLTFADKKRGIMRFKGGDGRGGRVPVKGGQRAVVYFDPAFCEEKVLNIPEPVVARHSDSEVTEAFKKL